MKNRRHPIKLHRKFSFSGQLFASSNRLRITITIPLLPNVNFSFSSRKLQLFCFYSGHCSTDDENLALYHINASTDSRSSSTTSTENPFPIEQQIKTESKSSCFLETPPPSLPDIHLTQESDSTFDKPNQQLKSKRKQDRPQRKSTPMKPSGYLSDEYGEPDNDRLLSDDELEKYFRELNEPVERQSSTNGLFAQQLFTYLHKNPMNFDKLERFRLENYETRNSRLSLISKILEKIFGLFHQKTLDELPIEIPEEIQTHIQLGLNRITNVNVIRKKISSKTKRLQNLKMNKKRSSLSHSSNDQQFLLSPASPLTPNEDLLSPNTNLTQTGGAIEQLPVLPKERDLYEIISCLCHCQIDNGFMIQVNLSNFSSPSTPRFSFSVKPVSVGHTASVSV